MVIKASASTEIRSLVQALSQPDDLKREAAIARLAVIGPRAVDRLVSTFPTADRHVRMAILRALESIGGDHRAALAARQGLEDGGDVAIAAIAVLRGLLDSPHGNAAAAALDSLITVALDKRVEHRVRIAALDALDRMPADVREKVANAAGRDVKADDALPQVSRDALWSAALDGTLPDEPALLRDALSTYGPTAPLGALRKLIDEIKRIEADPRGTARKQEWRVVRGSIHQALALRGSRVALYDLRESFAEGAARLPVSFLAAVQTVGDRSCLEPLAASLSGANAEDQWWQHQLAAAFRTIARREKITRRHALMRRISARWPQTPDRVFPKAGQPSSS
jgi:HEAT repeat protein